MKATTGANKELRGVVRWGEEQPGARDIQMAAASRGQCGTSVGVQVGVRRVNVGQQANTRGPCNRGEGGRDPHGVQINQALKDSLLGIIK